ncbi:MAG: LysR family transcriptional regulator [Ectothiorhodospiraceae bacterium]|nr:LysR family transcriptional regulator [Ectothiorhodospiraceae bacterium]MCH8504865.1 LysR family transcriptional regulator [Ectothiorhodospiraceae bacterium]
MMKLPPLKALPVFEAVARLNSFSRAAVELHVSQSAVSHQIRQLEDYLGEALFQRTGRRFTLTEQGREYLESVAAALGQIERASEKLQGSEHTHVRLAVFSSFAVRWLIPRLPDLQRRHPQLNLMLEMMDGPPMLSERVADCFISLRSRQRGFSSELLYAERLFPICSRQYWGRMQEEFRQAYPDDPSPPARLDAAWLTRYPLLSATSILGQPSEDWRQWLAAAGLALAPELRVQHFSHMLLALEAARHDQGIALSNEYMVDADEDPELVRLPCHTIHTGDEFHFVYKTSRRNEAGIQVLKQWLVQQAIASGLRPLPGTTGG